MKNLTAVLMTLVVLAFMVLMGVRVVGVPPLAERGNTASRNIGRGSVLW